MLELRPFRMADLDALGSVQAVQEQERAMMGDWRAVVWQNAARGPAWAVEDTGRVWAIGGMAIEWPGRARVWCLVADGMPIRVWPAAVKMARRMVGQAAVLGIRRLEAQVLAGWPEGARLMTIMGFEFRSIERAYDPQGRSYAMWAKVMV